MNKNATLILTLGLMFVLVLSAVCLWSDHTVTGSSTIIVPDDRSTIQGAINSAVDGDTIFIKAGTYYEHVTVNKTVTLAGENADTTIIDGNSTGHVVHIISDYVNVTGITVQNSGSVHMPSLDAGFCLDGTTGCTITENRAINNGFAAISLLYSNENTITHNNLSSAGWGGIHLLGSSRNTVSGNNIADKFGGINGHVSSNYNNITENNVSNSTYGMFYHAANYNTICRNNISTITAEGIWLQDQVNYNVVAENTFINNTVAIRVQGPNYNNTLSGNLITGAESGIKIESNARYTRITNNVLLNNRAGSDSWRAGIRLENGMDSQIDSNIIAGNYYGILLYSYSPRVSVWGNNITGNEFGLRVASGGSTYLTVSNNIVMNNQEYGIGLTGFGGASNYALISGNIIVNNSDGIALGQYSNFNTISYNNISINDFGFYIEYSTQNLIYGNNLVNNSWQAYVAAGSVNTWDDGYPSGGNYWSDYSGVDLYGGPDQDVPGGDGIGDTSYVINASNIDRYPLMNVNTPVHDITVEGITSSKSVVGQGYIVTINVTVANEGDLTEIFSVTVYAEAGEIETKELILTSGNSATVAFSWETSGWALDTYTLSAYAWPVMGETDTVDNTIADGQVTVAIPGDVDGNGEVELADLVRMAKAYGTRPIDAKWNPNCDIDNNGMVGLSDLVILAGHYGQ
jgi:parallel beta-helix repeat protein